MLKTITDWMGDAYGLATRAGWWNGYSKTLTADQLLSKLMLIDTEVAEAAEEVRLKGFNPTHTYYGGSDGKKPLGFPSEMADVIIRIMDLCGHLGVDLEAAIREKHEYNATRSSRHGGKRA